jgi:uncharacterized repeat protein (TIGR03803 family)
MTETKPGAHAGRLWLACVLATTAIARAQTATETVLHSFGNFPNGANPYGALILDSAGDLYGTTWQGGASNAGAVFEREASGTYKVLYSFTGGNDGGNPYAGVVLNSAGNLYGTTYNGGASGKGVVYQVSPAGQETVLYSFTGGNDGGNPYAGVTLDAAGNLYGTTYYGGTGNVGVVYKVSPSGQETVLYSFSDSITGNAYYGGYYPYAGVTLDAAGNLYGTTYLGGSGQEGMVYKLSPSGQETVLYVFDGHQAGAPHGGVILDSAGNLYGTATTEVYKLTTTGQYTVLASPRGAASSGLVMDSAGNLYGSTTALDDGLPQAKYGEVYKVSASGQFTVLYEFPGAANPENSQVLWVNPGVVLDAAGNIYGATPSGGTSGMVYEVSAAGKKTELYGFLGAPGGTYGNGIVVGPGGDIYGTTGSGGAANLGVVYKMTPGGRETVLHSFKGGTDGATPGGSLAFDSAGNVYGTTNAGGASDAGIVYKVTPSGQETILYTFTGGADGGLPRGVTIDSAGNLYGATFGGGSGSLTGIQEGVIFEVNPSGQETVLHSFTGLSDGGVPESGVILDPEGNLYGTTTQGGADYGGVLYRLSASGQYMVLYSFSSSSGFAPWAGVVRDSAGNLYGTTAAGGGPADAGVVYELDTSGNYTVLYAFQGAAEGSGPYTGVSRDSAGNLFGATQYGGETECFLGCGVVYEVDAGGNYTVLYSFTGGSDGASGAVISASEGKLYGYAGDGPALGGLLYKLTLQ